MKRWTWNRTIIYRRKWSGDKDETVVLVYLTSTRCQQWVASVDFCCWHFPRIKLKETNLKDLIHKRGKWVLMQWPTVKATLVTRATTGLSRKGNETEKVFCMCVICRGTWRERHPVSHPLPADWGQGMSLVIRAGWCVCVGGQRLKCVCVWKRVGVVGATGENPLWAEASVGLHLTQQDKKSQKFPSTCLMRELFAGSGPFLCVCG